MKKHIWEIGLALTLAFFAAGVIGMPIEYYLHPSQAFWVFFWCAILGGIFSLLIIFRNPLYNFYKRFKEKVSSILNIIKHTKEANEILILRNKQKINPEKWLHPVIDHIDLNRKGMCSTENIAFVRFSIDSHLLYRIDEYYVFVKLCLRNESVDSFQEVESKGWLEVEQAGNYPPIQRLERHRFAEYPMHFERMQRGRDKDSALLDMMARFRNNERVLAMLKIGIAFNKNDKPNPILLEGSRYFAPMNDYRMD